MNHLNLTLQNYIFPVRIYYEDTDALGLVYHCNYFKFAERARTEMLRHLGIQQENLLKTTGIAFVVRQCNADFLQSARLDDDLIVATEIIRIQGAAIQFQQTIKRCETLLTKINTQIVCIGNNGQAHRLPLELRNLLQKQCLSY